MALKRATACSSGALKVGRHQGSRSTNAEEELPSHHGSIKERLDVCGLLTSLGSQQQSTAASSTPSGVPFVCGADDRQFLRRGRAAEGKR
eukprot:1340-Heterococcus_DN1.PRE.12